MRKLIVWGCGGHGKVVLDIARAMNAFESIVFYDEDTAKSARVVAGLKVLSGELESLRQSGFAEFVVAIGPNRVRARCFATALEAGLTPVTCIHPTAWLSPSAQIGAGTVVMPRSVLQADARVGVDCIINTAVVVEHDCIVGDHSHLSPGVALGGAVTIGAYAHLGIGAIAIPRVHIGQDSIVGAGAVVLREVPDGVTAVGVPARAIRNQLLSGL